MLCSSCLKRTMESKVVTIKRQEDGYRIYDCPICGNGEVKVKAGTFYGKCDFCKATVIDYKPLEHQEAFHLSNAQYRMLIGGFGSGKTTAACAEVAMHGFTTPNGKTLITAPILEQVRQAVIPELLRFLPPWQMDKIRTGQNPYIRFKNGHEIIFFASNDQENLRSLNLTAFYIEEASGVDYAIFDQLMTRLRNGAGIVRDENGEELGYKFMGIVSTNPEEGWIKEKFLLVSDKIIGSKSIDTSVYDKIKVKVPDLNFHTFISSTRDNTKLHSSYVQKASAGKGEAWIRKYIDCYLDVREGAVFPDFHNYLVEPFAIPREWKRLVGFDPGFNDPTAVPKGAIDPKTGIIYIYDDYEVPEQPISYHAEQLKRALNGLDLFYPVQADPSTRKRNDRDGVSYAEYFYKLSGIYLDIANNDILYGIEKVRDYMYNGKLKFFNDLENLKKEAENYSYPTKNRNTNDLPNDKFNHLWDGIRYMIAKLPRDPREMNGMFIQSDILGQGFSAFLDKNNPHYEDDEGEFWGGMRL